MVPWERPIREIWRLRAGGLDEPAEVLGLAEVEVTHLPVDAGTDQLPHRDALCRHVQREASIVIIAEAESSFVPDLQRRRHRHTPSSKPSGKVYEAYGLLHTTTRVKSLETGRIRESWTLELPLIQVLARRMEAPERWTSPSETKRSHPAATPRITSQATRPATRWRAGPSCQFLDAALLPLLPVRHRPTPNATRCGKHSHICIISHAIQTNSSFSAGAPSSTYRGADAAWPLPPSRLAARARDAARSAAPTGPARASLPLARSLCRYTGVVHLRTGSTRSAGARSNVQGRTYRGRILRDSPTMWDRGV